MSLTDPLSNLITKVNNAARARKETVDIPGSKLGQKILEICKNDGYIEDVRWVKDNKQGILKVYLKYEKDRKSAIMGFKRISKPGLRVYVEHNRLPRVLNSLGSAIVSTSKGVITDREARKLKIGGEVLCYIW